MESSRIRLLVSRLFVVESERRPRTAWRLAIALVAIAVTLVATAETLVAVASGGILSSEGVGRALVKVAMAAALVGVAWLVDRRTVDDVGLGGQGFWRNVGFGLALGVAMTTAVFVVELAAGLLVVRDTFATRPGLGLDAGAPFALAFALTGLVYVAVGVSEEVIVRGYLMTNVAEGLNGFGPVGPRAAIGTAAILTSGVFGLVHLGNPDATAVSAFNISVIGLFLAAAYVATDDLGIPIGVHVTWNFSLAAVYGFPVSGYAMPATVLEVGQRGNPVITGGEFGPEAGLVMYLAVVVGAALTYGWVHHVQGCVRFRENVAVPDLRYADDRTQSSQQKPLRTTDGANGSGGRE